MNLTIGKKIIFGKKPANALALLCVEERMIAKYLS